MQTRRSFLSVVSAVAALPAGHQRGNLEGVEDTPNLCVHEHWGSLPAIGMSHGGFRADGVAGAQSPDVSLFDLLFDPYLYGFLDSGGLAIHALAAANGYADIMAMAREQPERVLEETLPHLTFQRSTGAVTCLREGIRELYGFDLDELSTDNWRQASARINARYRRLFDWYQEAMQVANLAGPVRPVGLSFMYEHADADAARKERSFTLPILRVDDFVVASWGPNERLHYCIAKTGLEPHDAPSWREFLGRVFELADQAGCIGIKQLQAYRRDLRFLRPQADSDVNFAPKAPAEHRAFEDFVVHECCRLADEREWPFQIHVGTNNLPNSGPLALEPLMLAYPRVRFVMLHCWPYLDEVAYLAKFRPNAYVDTCWLPILSPSHLERALEAMIGYVPAHKIMASQDATSIELACGASRVTRRILGKVLARRVAEELLTERHANLVAARVLLGNAAEVYRVGL